MKSKIKKIFQNYIVKYGLSTILFVLFFVLSNGSLTAQSPTPTPTPTPTTSASKNLEEIQRKIDETQDKINELEGEKKTLNSQIEVIDNQITLTELKIDSTEAQISDLTLDIDTADKKIDSLGSSLDKLSKVLVNRIKATYMIGSASSFQVLLSSSDVSDFVKRANYLRIAQAHDKRLIYDTAQAKNDYENQRDIFEDKKTKIENLKIDLKSYTSQLDVDRGGKQELLAVTKNDEKKFQELLARLQADAASINSALGSVGELIGTVNKGDIIASVGSSGCSTGSHLHLEVMTPAHVENGIVIGKENKVDPKPYLDNGTFYKVLDNYDGKSWTEGGSITTYFNEFYNIFGRSTAHTGLDIRAPFGTPIHAAESGTSYFSSAPCSYNIPGGSSLGKGIIVDHNNGIVTLYWHIP